MKAEVHSFAPPSLLDFEAVDGYPLRGYYWSGVGSVKGAVLINAATGVEAKYYQRFGNVLAEQGYAVLAYDYRGIGLSRRGSLRGLKATKLDWGTLDCEGAIQTLRRLQPDLPLLAVAHSIGGFVLGLAPSSHLITRALFVGCQYAYWRDYAPRVRWRYFWRWHLLMPTMACILGYFPGKRLGWLEDLPKGVAMEWGGRFHPSFHRYYRWLPHASSDISPAILERRISSFTAPILAIADIEDEYATRVASCRLLKYFSNSNRAFVQLESRKMGLPAMGHFGFFHDRYRESLWQGAIDWLGDGPDAHIPWPTDFTIGTTPAENT